MKTVGAALNLVDAVRGIRARLIALALATRLLRWLFGTAILICLAVISLKLLSLPVPGEMVILLILASVAAGTAVAISKSPTLLQCALMLDRALGLQERLSTALESLQGRKADSPLIRTQVDDTLERFRGVSLVPLFAPYRRALAGQAAYTSAALLFAGLLWVAPDLKEWRSVADPAGREASQREGLKLRAVVAGLDQKIAGLSPEQKEILEKTKQALGKLMRDEPNLREALHALTQVQSRVYRELAKMDPRAPEHESFSALADQVHQAVAALGGQLRKSGVSSAAIPFADPASIPLTDIRPEEAGTGSGISPHASAHSISPLFQPPAVPDDRAPAFTVPAGAMQTMVERQDWPREYDTLIRKYFTE